MTDLHVKVSACVGTLQVDVEFDCSSNRPLAIVGPNGAGKTTLLLLILGVRSPSHGRIAIAKDVLFDSAARVDVPTEDRGIAYVPQGYGLFPHMTARQNVELALACRRPTVPRLARKDEARALLERVGASACAERAAKDLSGGESQRVALARALGMSPTALVFDEPFSALDAGARGEMRAHLSERLRTLRLPAVVVTHDRADVHALDATVVVIEAGRVVQQGSLADLRRAPATDYVRQFCAAGGTD